MCAQRELEREREGEGEKESEREVEREREIIYIDVAVSFSFMCSSIAQHICSVLASFHLLCPLLALYNVCTMDGWLLL